MSGLSAEWVARARAAPIENEIKRRGIKLRGKVERTGPCPKCGGDDRFSVNTAKQVFFCRQCGARGDVIDLVMFLDGCDFVHAATALAGEPPPKTNGKDHPQSAEPASAKRVVARCFDYFDEGGNLLFAAERIEFQNADGSFVVAANGKRKKTFRQKRPDPDRPGQWINNVDGVRAVPYKLPEVIEAAGNDHFIVVVEGEAKADLLWSWNIPATCCAGGAKKWCDEHSEFLRGAEVVILPDNDEPGREHADMVGALLQGIAKSVRVLELRGLGPKEDIIDWAATQFDPIEEFHKLIASEARPWTPRAKPNEPGAQETGDQTGEKSAEQIGDIPLTVEAWLARDLPEPDRIMGEWFFTTSRTLLVGPTGVGKTNFGMATAGHSAIGQNFLHWHAWRPARILYIDGEMSARLFKQRLEDLVRRLGEIPKTLFPFSHEDIENFAPLNTPAGVAILNGLIEKVGGVDGIWFDNIMSLITGDMKEEEGWRQTLPLVTSLTKRGIAQVWLHHTGHDESRGYGTKTREWRMDNVIHLTTEERPDTDVSFRLEFRKARTRTPETRRDFQDATIALVNDEWTVEAPAVAAPGHVSPLGLRFLSALHNALASDDIEIRHGCRAVSLELWRAECVATGLLEIDQGKPMPPAARALFSKHRRELIVANYIACDATHAWLIK
jgi:hypothetical protein